MGVARSELTTCAYYVAVGRLGLESGETVTQDQTLQTSQTFELPTVSGNGRGLSESSFT